MEQLKKLIENLEFGEAVELAKLIHSDSKSDVSLYNYCVCLVNNGNLETAVSSLEELHKTEMKEHGKKIIMRKEGTIQMGVIMNLDVTLPEGIVAGQLFMIYGTMENKKGIEKIVQTGKPLLVPYSSESLASILNILNSNRINSSYTIFSYAEPLLSSNPEHYFLRVLFDSLTRGNSIELSECELNPKIKLPDYLEKLTCSGLKLPRGEKSIPNLRIPSIVQKLCLKNMSHSVEGLNSSEIESLDLDSCKLYWESGSLLSGNTISCKKTLLIRNEKVSHAIANEFLDISKIKNLHLSCCNQSTFCECYILCPAMPFYCAEEDHTKMSIDLSDGSVAMDSLFLDGVNVKDWKASKWTVKKLSIVQIPFLEKTQLKKVKEMRICQTKVDLSHLPKTLEKLSIDHSAVKCSGKINLPNLHTLELRQMMNSDSLLSHFKYKRLSAINFVDKIRFLNLKCIPEGAGKIKMNCKLIGPLATDKSILGGRLPMQKINTLILDCQASEMRLSHYYILLTNLLAEFQVNTLVIYKSSFYSTQDFDLLKSIIDFNTTGRINTIAIGNFKWQVNGQVNAPTSPEFTKSFLYNVFNQESEYYIVQLGKGKAVSKEIYTALYD